MKTKNNNCRGRSCACPLRSVTQKTGRDKPGPYRFISALILLAVLCVVPVHSLAQKRFANPPTRSASLSITTEPNAIIWIDNIRRGVTDASGRLELKKNSAGRHTLRVRAIGFREATVPLLAGRRSQTVKLIRTTDQAELAFQQAEDAREKAKDDESRKKAAELYREALRLRPAFPAAHVGLARVLLDLNQYRPALDEIEAARRGVKVIRVPFPVGFREL